MGEMSENVARNREDIEIFQKKHTSHISQFQLFDIL